MELMVKKGVLYKLEEISHQDIIYFSNIISAMQAVLIYLSAWHLVNWSIDMFMSEASCTPGAKLLYLAL